MVHVTDLLSDPGKPAASSPRPPLKPRPNPWPVGSRFYMVRPDRVESARGQSGPAAVAAQVPAGRHRVIAPGRARHWADRRSERTKRKDLNTDDTVASWVERVGVNFQHFLTSMGTIQRPWCRTWSGRYPCRNRGSARRGQHFSVKRLRFRQGVDLCPSERTASLHRVQLHAAAGDGLPAPLLAITTRQRLQVGGLSVGNITAGLRSHPPGWKGPKAMRMVCVPLVTKADGTKFGKTAGGAIRLDANPRRSRSTSSG